MLPYSCGTCGRRFKTGGAHANHLRVHAAPPTASGARSRFPGSAPYDPDEYPPSQLTHDDGAGGSGAGAELPPRLQQPARLSTEDEVKLRLCELKTNGAAGRGLSEADMNNILRIVKLVAGSDVNPDELFKNCDELTRQLLEQAVEHPDLMWYVAEVKAPSFPDVQPARLVYRNFEEVLRSLVLKQPIKWGFWDYETTQGGDRIYSHPCDAEWFEAVCAFLAGTNILPLPVQLWSDKANLTKRGNKSYYPLSAVVLNVLFDSYREQWPESAIAFLPIIDRSMVPTDMTDREFNLYKAEIEVECLQMVLLPTLCSEHSFNCKDRTGVSRDVVVVLHSWVADFEEQMKLMGLIGQTGCAWCKVAYNDLLPTPGAAVAPLRTVQDVMIATGRMQQAWKAEALTEFDRLRTQTRQQGPPPILNVLHLRGFSSELRGVSNLIDSLVPASVMPPDTLHVFDEGITKRLVNALAKHADAKYGKSYGRWLTDTLALRFQTALDMAFIEETPWPNPWLVFRGRDKKTEGCSGLQACEMRAVCQLLPTLLPGILGVKPPHGRWKACKPDDDYVTNVWCMFVHYYMELKRYNRPAGHTARTLAVMERIGEQFLDILRQHFLADQTSSWSLPKAHAGFGPHVGNAIRLLGPLNYLGTEWGENSVKQGHLAYEATNKNNSNAEEQMATHLAKRAITRQTLEKAGLTVAPAGLGTRRTAGREATRTGMNTLASEAVGRVAITDFTAHPLPAVLAGRPGMASFPKELRRYLVAEGQPADAAGVIHIVNSAALKAKPQHHPDEYVNTTLHTVYAVPRFRGRRRLSFVALEGMHTDGSPKEWIAQLLLLFRYEGTSLAYVQFLVEDPALAGKGPLFGAPGCSPLIWERVGNPLRYSYCVTPLDMLIRREFVTPNLSSVYAQRRKKRGRRAKRRARETWSGESSGSSSSSGDSSSSSDTDDDVGGASLRHVADEVERGGVAKRWPNWIRNPFIWGWG